jgi:hypothetical protein
LRRAVGLGVRWNTGRPLRPQTKGAARRPPAARPAAAAPRRRPRLHAGLDGVKRVRRRRRKHAAGDSRRDHGRRRRVPLGVGVGVGVRAGLGFSGCREVDGGWMGVKASQGGVAPGCLRGERMHGRGRCGARARRWRPPRPPFPAARRTARGTGPGSRRRTASRAPRRGPGRAGGGGGAEEQGRASAAAALVRPAIRNCWQCASKPRGRPQLRLSAFDPRLTGQKNPPGLGIWSARGRTRRSAWPPAPAASGFSDRAGRVRAREVQGHRGGATAGSARAPAGFLPANANPTPPSGAPPAAG